MSTQQIWHGNSIELCSRFKPGTIQCVVTDPPFGVNNKSNMATTPFGKDMARKIAGDETPEQALNLFYDVMTVLMPAMKADSDIYVFTAGQVLDQWLIHCTAFMKGFKYERKAILVWAKGSPGLGDLETWGQAIEYVLYFKRGSRPRTSGVTRANGIFQDPQISPGKLIHPHEKPTSLLRKLIEHSTDKGDWLVDPFGGSGSLARAAEECGRNAVCIELDEKNFKLANDALHTGQGAGLF